MEESITSQLRVDELTLQLSEAKSTIRTLESELKQAQDLYTFSEKEKAEQAVQYQDRIEKECKKHAEKAKSEAEELVIKIERERDNQVAALSAKIQDLQDVISQKNLIIQEKDSKVLEIKSELESKIDEISSLTSKVEVPEEAPRRAKRKK
jgi:hypothetical protein